MKVEEWIVYGKERRVGSGVEQNRMGQSWPAPDGVLMGGGREKKVHTSGIVAHMFCFVKVG